MMGSDDDAADYAWPVLTGQVPVPIYPSCDRHEEIQHRDRLPPWCNHCGWNRGRPAVPPKKLGRK